MAAPDRSLGVLPEDTGKSVRDRLSTVFTVVLICGIAFVAAVLITGEAADAPHLPVTETTVSPVMVIPAAPAGTPAPAGTCRPFTIAQTDGTEVSFPCMPQRIIAANANAAEMLIALGAEDRIVGGTKSTLSVPFIRSKIPNASSIGDWQTPNIEQILALRPDVVISYSSYRPKNIDQITAHNITIVSLDCYRLSTLASDARALGKLTGKSNGAEVYARTVEDTIAEVSGRIKKIRDDDRPTVYFESYSDLTVSAAGSAGDELIELAGGKNVAGPGTSPTTKVNAEWVVAQQPDFVFKAMSSTNPRSFRDAVADIRERTGWVAIPAVENDRVYAFSNEIIYGPRAYIGLVSMAQILHPDKFRDMHPRAMLNEYSSTYVAGTNRTGMIYP